MLKITKAGTPASSGEVSQLRTICPEPYDRANDRVSRRDGKPQARSPEQQGPSGGQRRQHSPHEVVGRHEIHVEHALAHGVGHMTAREERPRELQQRSDEDGAGDGERARADARSHRVGDIVRADRPGHVERHDARDQELDRNVVGKQ